MSVQIITTPSGERLVLLPESEWLAMLDLLEDRADAAAVAEFRRRLAAGEEELVPSAVVDRILAGDNRVRVWREYRGMALRALAEAADLSPAYLSQIETGARVGTLDTLKRIAGALGVDVDDLS